MCVMNQSLTVGLGAESAIHGGFQGRQARWDSARWYTRTIAWSISPTLEQHQLDVAEVLETFHRCKLFAQSSSASLRDQS